MLRALALSRGLAELLAVTAVLGLSSCGGDGKGKRPAGEIVFWHVLTGDYEKHLLSLIDEFNASGPPRQVRPQSMLGYNQIYRKTKLALVSGRLPDVAVAMESMVSEYYPSGRNVDLDALVADAEHGFGPDGLADFFPPMIDTNRYQQFGGKLLSFPFTKSVLMNHVNMDMVRRASFTAPPETWEQFLAQCRAIKKTLGVIPYALSIDASTIDAMVFSFGGEVYDAKRRRTTFDSPAGLATFRLLATLAREGLAHRVDYGSRNDRVRFARKEAAFMIRSSAGRPMVAQLVGDAFDWDLAVIPHGKDAKPATVLFGSNVCLFTSDPERERAAWALVKFLTSREITARWATMTGYLPVRKSALETDTLKRYLAETKQSPRPIEGLKVARFEPNATGWQEMRELIEKAESDVFEGRETPEQAVRTLDEASERLSAR